MDVVDFKILSTGNPEFPQIVVALNHNNLYESMLEIASELSKAGFHGRVLMDQLGSHGDGKNRFVVAFFDGTKFELSKRTPREQIPAELEVLGMRTFLSNNRPQRT